jgi:hypothetical protein
VCISGGERLSSGIVLHWDGASLSPDRPASSRGILGIDANAARVVAVDGSTLWERSGGAWAMSRTVFEPFDVALAGDELVLLKRDFGQVAATDGSPTPDLEFFSLATVDPWRLAVSASGRIAIVGEGGQIHERIGEDRHRARTEHQLRRAWIASDGTVWAVGDAGTIVRAEPTRMRTIDAGDQRTMLAVHARAGDDVWTAGLAGNVLHYDGSTWTSIESGVDVDLRAIAAAADGTTWVGGEEGVAVRFVGTTPERHDVGVAGADIRALVADDGASIWAAGSVLRRWDGSAWTEVAPLVRLAYDAWSPGPGDVWLAEEDGHVQRFVDGIEQPGLDITGDEATAIWGTSATSVYVAQRGPSLRRWSGTAWEGVLTPSVGLDVWTSVFGTSDDEVVAVGRTTVRSATPEWIVVNAGAALVDVHGVGNERWAVGWGEELRYGVVD